MPALHYSRNVIVTKLSGGMKRKINLGIALIGDSKVGPFITLKSTNSKYRQY